MKLSICWNEDEKEMEVPMTESDVWKAVGKTLEEISIPNEIRISCERGTASLSVVKRGKYVKNGIEYPSMYVTCSYNLIHLPPSDYKEAYLTCVNPESNNYKFYHLKPCGTEIRATYGRIGSEKGEMFGVKDLKNPYPSYLYWIRYYEKLSKGYVDQSHIYLAAVLKPRVSQKSLSAPDESSPDAVSYDLYKRLRACARQYVSEHLVNSNVTIAQVKASKRFLKQLGERKTITGFNNKLMELLQVCPRKVRNVSDLLAVSKSDFISIVQREETLVAAMEALVPNSNLLANCFENMNIEVYLATEKQKEQVLSHLSDTLKGKVKRIYRVINQKNQKDFNDYLKQNNIKKVRQLWHGSRNENWFSIITNGLQLNPNAVITGKMFGPGIYFAPSSEKSWNYTSYHNTIWAGGNSDTAFMGLYCTAYGNQKDVYTSGYYDQQILKRGGYHCVHAHAGIQLRNDEIVYYDEKAIILNYIVEFA